MPRNPKQDANLDRGKATRFRSGENAAREAGQKGGIASGKARRFKAIARELLTEEEIEELILALMDAAKRGSVAAFKILLAFDPGEEEQPDSMDALSRSLEALAAEMDAAQG